MSIRIDEVTTQTRIKRCTGYPEEWTLGEAFAALKKAGMADILRRDGFDKEVDLWAFCGLEHIRRGESLRNGAICALWYVARINEITADWLEREEVSNESRSSRISHAKRQVISKY